MGFWLYSFLLGPGETKLLDLGEKKALFPALCFVFGWGTASVGFWPHFCPKIGSRKKFGKNDLKRAIKVVCGQIRSNQGRFVVTQKHGFEGWNNRSAASFSAWQLNVLPFFWGFSFPKLPICPKYNVPKFSFPKCPKYNFLKLTICPKFSFPKLPNCPKFSSPKLPICPKFRICPKTVCHVSL